MSGLETTSDLMLFSMGVDSHIAGLGCVFFLYEDSQIYSPVDIIHTVYKNKDIYSNACIY